MAVIRTSTGTVQEVATEDGPMTTAAGSRQYGLIDEPVSGAEPIPGADTYFYLDGNGMQEVTPGAAGFPILPNGYEFVIDDYEGRYFVNQSGSYFIMRVI